MKSDRLSRCFDEMPDRRCPGGGIRLAIGMAAALAMFVGAITDSAAQRASANKTALPPPGPLGIWFDDTGQGAIEIAPCGERLCGRIVWLKEPTSQDGQALTDALNPDPRERQRPICGLQIIGGLEPQPNGKWDRGWIYDPKEGKSYDVEISLRGPDRLQVKGYLGVKFLSESFIWTRAPADLQRCAALPPGAQATAR